MLATALLAAALTVPPGIYSSYHVHRETGDELGMELAFSGGSRPSIRFTLCEGACSLIVQLPVRLVPGGFLFDYAEPTSLPGDKPGPQLIVHFAAQLRHGALVVRQIDGYDTTPALLRRIAAPRALALPISVQ